MHKYECNGYYPIVRCICGYPSVVKQPKHCHYCGAVLWLEWSKKKVVPMAIKLQCYPKKLQIHKRPKITGWVLA